MKELLVISGKGGTGKTSIVGAFAVLADCKVLADCDVDAADLHLLLSPAVRAAKEFRAGQQAVLDPAKCVGAGKCSASAVCAEACRFGAIGLPSQQVPGPALPSAPVFPTSIQSLARDAASAHAHVLTAPSQWRMWCRGTGLCLIRPTGPWSTHASEWPRRTRAS